MSSNSAVNILRLLALGIVCVNSLIILGIAAYLTYVSELYGVYFVFAAFAIAIAALTLLVFPPIIMVGMFRRGALFSSIIVEVAVLGLFWVLWLSTAAYTADQFSLLPTNCNYTLDFKGHITTCSELQAIHAFTWLNWLILTVYWPFLLIMALVQQNRGNPVWSKSVGEVNMFAPGVIVAVYPPQQQQPMMYAPQPMQQQPQMAYPPNAPGATYAPVPSQPPQKDYTPQPTPVGYTVTPPPQYPQQYPTGGGYPQV